MFIIKSILAFLLFSFISTSSFAKQISYDCKPKSAAAIRSDGIQVFKITGKEKSVEVIIRDGENLDPESAKTSARKNLGQFPFLN